MASRRVVGWVRGDNLRTELVARELVQVAPTPQEPRLPQSHQMRDCAHSLITTPMVSVKAEQDQKELLQLCHHQLIRDDRRVVARRPKSNTLVNPPFRAWSWSSTDRRGSRSAASPGGTVGCEQTGSRASHRREYGRGRRTRATAQDCRTGCIRGISTKPAWSGIIVPPCDSDPVEFQSGNPYGDSDVVGDGPSCEPTLQAAQYQTRRIVVTATSLKTSHPASIRHEFRCDRDGRCCCAGKGLGNHHHCGQNQSFPKVTHVSHHKMYE